MKISKKTAAALCIIVPIFALALVLRFNQKPNFSKYHSYAVVTDNGNIPLTDEQFQQIVQSYMSDDTLEYRWLSPLGPGGHKLILFKSNDMSGNYVTMYTGVTDAVPCLYVNNRSFIFDSSKPIEIVEQIIQESTVRSESEQEL